MILIHETPFIIQAQFFGDKSSHFCPFISIEMSKKIKIVANLFPVNQRNYLENNF